MTPRLCGSVQRVDLPLKLLDVLGLVPLALSALAELGVARPHERLDILDDDDVQRVVDALANILTTRNQD